MNAKSAKSLSNILRRVRKTFKRKIIKWRFAFPGITIYKYNQSIQSIKQSETIPTVKRTTEQNWSLWKQSPNIEEFSIWQNDIKNLGRKVELSNK